MMVLVDTSVWISHLRDGNPALEELLETGRVMCHTFVIGELACGSMKNREEILSYLGLLPKSIDVLTKEILAFIENKKLMGIGLGYIDIALAASALLTGSLFWTIDKKLAATAVSLGIEYNSKQNKYR